MTFEKYPSIDSAEKKKTLDRVLEQYPELVEENCYIQEKIDGSNVQFYVDENNDIHVGKRSAFLDPSDNFHGIWETFNRYRHYIQLLAKAVRDEYNGNTVRLYGELFGPGVQNRIDYGNERQIQIFDVMVDGHYIPWGKVLDIDQGYYTSELDLCVHNFDIMNFKDAMNFDPSNVRSLYSPSNQKAEGVVIKPVRPYVDKGSGNLIAFKIKREDFSEKGGKPKKEKSFQEEFSEKGRQLKDEFDSLITKNRVYSVFSKEGEIQDESQIGSYIKLVTEDAKEEFFKDWRDEFKQLDDKEKKKIFKNVGPIVVPMLKEFL